MLGWDFLVFWQIGQAILAGVDPYSVAFSRYPPATTYLFTVFGLLPYTIAFAIWVAASLVFYLDGVRRAGVKRLRIRLVWLLFTPTLFNLMAGQLDLPFFWLATFLPASGWKAWTAAALLTLKPQLALVVLPWFLVRWLVKDRPTLFRWAGLSALIHLLPLLVDPNIYTKWLAALSGVSEMKSGVSSGIFSLSALNLPLWLIALVAVVLAAWSVIKLTAPGSRAALFLANPLTIWYDGAFLAATAPAILLIPLSWLALGASYLLQSSIPLVSIPLAALIYIVWYQLRPAVSLHSASSAM